MLSLNTRECGENVNLSQSFTVYSGINRASAGGPDLWRQTLLCVEGGERYLRARSGVVPPVGGGRS
jgi:hypothetical protein